MHTFLETDLLDGLCTSYHQTASFSDGYTRGLQVLRALNNKETCKDDPKLRRNILCTVLPFEFKFEEGRCKKRSEDDSNSISHKKRDENIGNKELTLMLF